MKYVLRLTILTFLLFISASAFAQPCMQQGGINTPGFGGICAPWMNLTEEQEKQITELHNEFNKKTIAIQKKIYKKRLELKAILIEDNIKTEKALNLQKRISELTAKIDRQALKSMLKANSLLAADQRALLPPGCTLGFGMMNCGQRPCMTGNPMGPGCNKKMGRGKGKYR